MLLVAISGQVLHSRSDGPTTLQGATMTKTLISCATGLVLSLTICSCGGGGLGYGGAECLTDFDCDWNEMCFDDSCEGMFGLAYDVYIQGGSFETDADWDSMGGAPDAYVVVEVGSDSCRTSTQDDDFYPRWYETCTMVISEGDSLKISTYDEDVSSDDLMSWYEVAGDDLADLIKLGGATISNADASLIFEIEPD